MPTCNTEGASQADNLKVALHPGVLLQGMPGPVWSSRHSRPQPQALGRPELLPYLLICEANDHLQCTSSSDAPCAIATQCSMLYLLQGAYTGGDHARLDLFVGHKLLQAVNEPLGRP